MEEKLLIDMKNAMKSRNKERLSVIRMAKGAIQLEEISKKRKLTDDEIITIISKQIKTRKESIVEFTKGSRADLIASTEKEIIILNEYMPAGMSEEEVLKIIDKAFSDVSPKSPRDMGKIMGLIIPIVKGKADLGFVNRIIREKLDSL